MEIIHGLSTFEKPVISEHICIGNPSIAVTDTIFLTKLHKRENQLDRSSP